MELHERLATTSKQPTTQQHAGPDPFAELKTQIHLSVIGELGPQLFNVTIEPATLRERVIADIRSKLGGEVGLSRDDRDRLTGEIADDILGHGPLERLLADETVTEIMVNGPFDIWSSARAGSTRRPSASTTSRICAGSSTRWSRRSAGGSTSRRRWSTPGCPTGAA